MGRLSAVFVVTMSIFPGGTGSRSSWVIPVFFVVPSTSFVPSSGLGFLRRFSCYSEVRTIVYRKKKMEPYCRPSVFLVLLVLLCRIVLTLAFGPDPRAGCKGTLG